MSDPALAIKFWRDPVLARSVATLVDEKTGDVLDCEIFKDSKVKSHPIDGIRVIYHKSLIDAGVF